LLALRTLTHFGKLEPELGDTQVWHAAVTHLSHIATSDAFALVRDAALDTLVTLAGRSATPTLNAAARSDVEPSVRAHAARLLGELRVNH
jgi:HEAT repeat protein